MGQPRVERGEDGLDQRPDREHAGDVGDGGAGPDREEDPRQEEDRKHHEIDDRGGGVRVRHHRGHGDTTGAERRRPHHERHQQRNVVTRKRHAIEEHAEQCRQDHQQDRHQKLVDQQARKKVPGPQRRAALPLQQTRIAADRQLQRHVHEAGSDHTIGDDARDEVLVVVQSTEEIDRGPGVQRREDHKKHQREGEGEERRRRITPEGQLFEPRLMDDQPHLTAQPAARPPARPAPRFGHPVPLTAAVPDMAVASAPPSTPASASAPAPVRALVSCR